MANLSLQIQNSALQHLQHILPGINIQIPSQFSECTVPLYTIGKIEAVQVQDLKKIVGCLQSQLNFEELRIVDMVERVGSLIGLLEANEECRLSWVEGVGGRLDRGTKVNLEQIDGIKGGLERLIEQCKKIEGKTQLLEFIRKKKEEIFTWNEFEKIYECIKPVVLLEFPEYYGLCPLLNEPTYLLSYQLALQKLYQYKQQLQKCMQSQLSLGEFQNICAQMLSSESYFTQRKKIDELIKYVLCYCNSRYTKMTDLIRKVWKMRQELIQSTVRVYYLNFHAEKDIGWVDQYVSKFQDRVISWVHKEYEKGKQFFIVNAVLDQQNGYQVGNEPDHNFLNKNRISITPLQEEIKGDKKHIQKKFNAIFIYLTDRPQRIFLNNFSIKLNRRCLELIKIQERVMQIEKMLFRPECAFDVIAVMKFKERHSENVIASKFKQLVEMKRQFEPINDQHFRVLFEEVQNLMVFVREIESHKWIYKLKLFQKDIVNQHMFDLHGSRIWSSTNSLVTSRMSQGLSRSRVISQMDFFQESYRDVIDNTNLSSSKVSEREELSREEVYRQGMEYINGIIVDYAEELRDQSNFKVYLLPRLIDRIEKMLHQRQEQAFDIQLKHLIYNLKLIPFVTKSELNQQRLDLILFPVINSELFSTFRQKMEEYYGELVGICHDIEQTQMKRERIEDRIIEFANKRLKYLKVLLQNFGVLDVIAQRVGQVNVVRQSYELSSTGTSNMFLTLLLAEKEVKAFRKSLEDGVSKHSLSRKALDLVVDVVCPLFLRSLSFPFERQRNQQTLLCLMGLSQNAVENMNYSQQLMEKTIQKVQNLKNNRTDNIIEDILTDVSHRLSQCKQQLLVLMTESKKYMKIGVDKIIRQLVRIEQFIEICQKGSQTSSQIVDQRSKNFLELVKQTQK